MLKIASNLTGENYQLLAADTPASKKKVTALAIAMLLPVLIWVFNGFMLSFQVLKADPIWSVVTAIVCGLLVFFIEKLIIMANGNKSLTFFRVFIGILVALLGSMAIDEVIFKDDIDISVAAIKETTVGNAKKDQEKRFTELNHYDELENSINDAQNKYDNAVTVTLAEADGSKGTKYRGVGDVARLKDQKANERKNDLQALLIKKSQLTVIKDSLVNNAGNRAEMSFNEHALLTRIKALFQLVGNDGYMLTIFILFTLLMFSFEFLVVILKSTWKETNYERRIKMIEEIGCNRINFVMRKESIVMDPGYYLPQLQESRNAVKHKSSIYNAA